MLGLRKIIEPLQTGVSTVAKTTGEVVAKSATGAGEVVKDATVGAAKIAADAVRNRWILAILLTLVVIHIARMGIEGTLWGLAAPFFVTLADFVAAFLFGLLGLVIWFVFVAVFDALSAPMLGDLFMRLTAGEDPSRLDILFERVIRVAGRIKVRLQKLGPQLSALLNDWQRKASIAIQIGLFPVLALAAISPVWGFTWYFNTENWGAGIRHLRAEMRTDPWRQEYVKAAKSYHSTQYPGQLGSLFAIEPPGLEEDSFSFIVIGDTGDGDASQFALHDQLLSVAQDPDVKFVLVASDVIYPSGDMRDYERNFYLPFKGITKPIYAMPGNHDWYGKLEAFMANFYEPEYARAVFKQTGSKL